MSLNERILNLLRRYEELHEQGRSPSLEELCRDCPDLLPEVQRRLDLLQALAASPDGSTRLDDPFAAPAATPSPAAGTTAPDPPAPGTRYRPLRLHARGGLGEVLLAHDEELHRDVALKRMQARCADDADSRRRFLLEAEVTARLEHPGIVPVYGLVHDDAGQPCYAMRFIEGPSLKEALEAFHKADTPGRDTGERTLALRKLLGDFVAVCKAVGYAHGRAVVHRDLKPHNVMLGKYGEVLVVDWGLAKKVERTEAERAAGEASVKPMMAESAGEGTGLGQVMGTPAYMSPEQAAGRWDLLRPPSDIYSLGATLYALLTGRAPFQETSPQEILEKVKRGEFLPPRQVKPDVPRPLEAICLRAMALRPQDRYHTALAVADDVERWLADEPVAAYREPWTARSGRWLRRRRTLVTSIGVALFLLVLGGVAAVWWYEHERSTRRSQAEGEVRLNLKEAALLGERARTLIDNAPSWETTLGAARAAVQRAEEILEREPDWAGGELAQEVAQAKARLQTDEKDRVLLAAFDRVREEQSQYDASKRRFKLAEAYPRLKQALADYGLALQSLPADKAAALLQQRPPAVQEQVMGLLQECWFWAPEQEADAKRWLAALLVQADGVGWRQHVRQTVEQKQGAVLEQLLRGPEVARQPAAFLVWLGRVLPLDAALGVLRRAQQQYPGDFWVNLELAGALYDSVFGRGGGARPARVEELPAVNEAVAFFRVAVGLRPGNAPAHTNLGIALAAQGDVKGAIACYHKALDLDPKLVQPHNNLGNALQAQRNLKGAIACYKKALALDPKFAPAHTNLGSALADQGDVKGAIACFKKALALDPKLAPAHTNLGNALQAQGEVKEAIACFQKALALEPKDAKAHYNLGAALADQGDVKGAIVCYKKALQLDPKFAMAHNNLGLALQDQGDVSGAIACYTKALALEPKNAHAHTNLGTALQAQGDLKGAIACYTKALDLDPKDASTHTNLGVALQAQGDLKGAMACYQKALTLDPKHAQAHTNLGTALRAQGDVKGAIACYKQALDLDPKLTKAHNNLGNALQAQGDLKGAIACYRKALALNPKYAPAHTNLGTALYEQGEVKGAIACYKKALALEPKNAHAHGALGQALLAQGDFKEARAATQQALQLLPNGHPLRPLVTRQLHECLRLLDLDSRLPALLQGDEQPQDTAEQLALADLCQQYKKRYAAAARFYADAFAAGAAQTTKRAYHAASAAVLAAAGKGEDASKLDAKEKSRLRQQALAWLRDNIKHYVQELEDGDAKTRQAVQQTLQHWQKDPDFDSVRGQEALAQLPEAERAAWQQLWVDVETLLKKTQNSTK
jgi:tetratricopeptide (TPR) repeat protein/tRNA A-37 threonylcarbamoyl transferase component Bud32